MRAPKVHLAGLGLVGSLAALRLDDRGVDFTWHDPERPVTAWRASTGCCYPSDEAEDRDNYRRFPREVMAHPFLGEFCEEAAYGFVGERAPHLRKATVAFRVEGLSFLAAPSFHLNAQLLVPAVRQLFASRRRPGPERGRTLVHAHGFHRRRPTRLFWGYHTVARVHPEGALARAVGDRPMCLNLQFKRFGTWYAYPRLGGEWREAYLGSSLVCQSMPRRLDPRPKYARMRKHLAEVTGGLVRVEDPPQPAFVEGWRPQGFAEASPPAWREGDEIYLRPQYASGFRHHLTQTDALLALL